MRNFLRSIFFVFFIAACFAQQKPATGNSRANDEKAIRAESEAWSRSASKTAEEFVSFYSPDATVFPPNSPVVSGKANILAFWKKMKATPGLSLSFGTTHLEVAKSGDMAYEAGTYKMVSNDAKGKPMTEIGKYVAVWKKQADGKWKAAADIFNAGK